MTSFQIALKPQRRAAARFVAHVRDVLQRRIVDSGRPQAQIAQAIDVHRSVLNRELRGRRDISLSRIAEIAWALGDEVRFDLVPIEAKGNRPAVAAGVDSSEIVGFPDPPTSTDRISLDRFKGELVPISEMAA
jgi:hypothetical protein